MSYTFVIRNILFIYLVDFGSLSTFVHHFDTRKISARIINFWCVGF